jgi:serine/threonine-protein kinase
MAPEMALGKGEVDGRADIYSLGCVAYWLLTGQQVFRAESPLATVVAHVQEQPVPPSQRSEFEIPAALEQVVLACLEKDPANRPEDASELDARLSACRLEDVWTSARAREWWTLHLSEVEVAFADYHGGESDVQPILTVSG